MVRVYQAEVMVVKTTLNATDCCTCGVVFAITAELEKERRRDHKSFYCPNGHSMVFGANSTEQENARLKEQLRAAEELERRLVDRQSRLENDLMDQAKELKRVRRRHASGTCPHCNRTFANMARHIAKQHPVERTNTLATSRTKAAKAVQPVPDKAKVPH